MLCPTGRIVFPQQQKYFGIVQPIAVVIDDRQKFIGTAPLQCDENLPTDLRVDVGWIDPKSCKKNAARRLHVPDWAD